MAKAKSFAITLGTNACGRCFCFGIIDEPVEFPGRPLWIVFPFKATFHALNSRRCQGVVQNRCFRLPIPPSLGLDGPLCLSPTCRLCAACAADSQSWQSRPHLMHCSRVQQKSISPHHGKCWYHSERRRWKRWGIASKNAIDCLR